MNIFDLIGPVMVGPSSSHTAGAARIGFVAGRILGERPVKADISLHGSFADTGIGHGTDRALIAGLLGMRPDDTRIPDAFAMAEDQGLEYSFRTADIPGAHPNTVKMILDGEKGTRMSIQAESVGGGRIQVRELDGMELCFPAEKPTIIIRNEDQPGIVADVSNVLAALGINIATFHVSRNSRGGEAVMVIECDSKIDDDLARMIRRIHGVIKAVVVDPE